jgi:hypothetical protein
MSSNIEVSIKVELKPTDAPPTPLDGEAMQQEEGRFHLILESEKSLDIDALEDGMLRTSFPALRNALSTYLTREGKKNAREDASFASRSPSGPSASSGSVPG